MVDIKHDTENIKVPNVKHDTENIKLKEPNVKIINTRVDSNAEVADVKHHAHHHAQTRASVIMIIAVGAHDVVSAEPQATLGTAGCEDSSPKKFPKDH